MATEAEIKKKFSKRLKNLRKEHGYNQDKLADKLNLSSKSTISAYENGRIPKAEMLNQLAEIFNVSIDYLLGNTNIKKPNIAKIPKDFAEYLNDETKRWFLEEIQREPIKAFTREAREASDRDIAVAIQTLKAIKKVKEKEEDTRNNDYESGG